MKFFVFLWTGISCFLSLEIECQTGTELSPPDDSYTYMVFKESLALPHLIGYSEVDVIFQAFDWLKRHLNSQNLPVTSLMRSLAERKAWNKSSIQEATQ